MVTRVPCHLLVAVTPPLTCAPRGAFGSRGAEAVPAPRPGCTWGLGTGHCPRAPAAPDTPRGWTAAGARPPRSPWIRLRAAPRGLCLAPRLRLEELILNQVRQTTFVNGAQRGSHLCSVFSDTQRADSPLRRDGCAFFSEAVSDRAEHFHTVRIYSIFYRFGY